MEHATTFACCDCRLRKRIAEFSLLPDFLVRTLCLLIGTIALCGWSPSLLSAQHGVPPPSAYTLQPGDVVRIAIWREPELGGDFQIDENGQITLPLLGEQKVAHLSIEQLRNSLTSQYRVQLRNPSITITPLRRVNVFGQINRPGLYAVDPTISLAELVAMAGGVNGIGDIDNIRIYRDGVLMRDRIGGQATIAAVQVQSGDQVVIGHTPWISRNIGLLLSIPTTIAGVIGLINLIR